MNLVPVRKSLLYSELGSFHFARLALGSLLQVSKDTVVLVVAFPPKARSRLTQVRVVCFPNKRKQKVLLELSNYECHINDLVKYNVEKLSGKNYCLFLYYWPSIILFQVSQMPLNEYFINIKSKVKKN